MAVKHGRLYLTDDISIDTKEQLKDISLETWLKIYNFRRGLYLKPALAMLKASKKVEEYLWLPATNLLCSLVDLDGKIFLNAGEPKNLHPDDYKKFASNQLNIDQELSTGGSNSIFSKDIFYQTVRCGAVHSLVIADNYKPGRGTKVIVWNESTQVLSYDSSKELWKFNPWNLGTACENFDFSGAEKCHLEKFFSRDWENILDSL